MEKLNLVIFDRDIEYSLALSETFNRRYYKYFRISIIDNYEQFEELIFAAKKIDLLLVNESFKERMDDFKFIKGTIYFTESRDKQNIEEKVLYKYQSVTSLFNFIKRIYKTIDKVVTFDDEYNEGKLITVTSPSGGIGKTAISVGIANKIALHGKKVLYLNMEEFSSLEEIFGENNNKSNISDLFYNVNEEDKIKDIILSMVNKGKDGIWYINGPNSVLDLAELKSREVTKAVSFLKKYTDFDYIILDLGGTFNGIYSTLLHLSDKVFVIMQQTNISMAKVYSLLSQFDGIEKIELVMNKFEKDKKTVVSEKILQIKDYIYQNIEMDKLLDNSDLTFDKITFHSKFSFGVDQLVNKILREENRKYE